MTAVKDAIGTLEQLGIPGKGVSALRKLWDHGTVFVESSDSELTIRPRLAKLMEHRQLITISDRGLARLDTLGSNLAFDIFGDE